MVQNAANFTGDVSLFHVLPKKCGSHRVPLCTVRHLALDPSSIGQLVEICVKLSLDPTSAVLRAPLERTLLALLHSEPANSIRIVRSYV